MLMNCRLRDYIQINATQRVESFVIASSAATARAGATVARRQLSTDDDKIYQTDVKTVNMADMDEHMRQT